MLLCGSGVLIFLIRYQMHPTLVPVLFWFWYPHILFHFLKSFFYYSCFNTLFNNDYDSLLINCWSVHVLFQSPISEQRSVLYVFQYNIGSDYFLLMVSGVVEECPYILCMLLHVFWKIIIILVKNDIYQN